MSLESLVVLLDESRSVTRPESLEPVWLSVGRSNSAAGLALLATVVRALAANEPYCFLSTDGTVKAEDFGAATWGQPVAAQTWLVPRDVDPTTLLESPAHSYGNYAR
jgi:hypothetical protein